LPALFGRIDAGLGSLGLGLGHVYIVRLVWIGLVSLVQALYTKYVWRERDLKMNK
jgi:hypothetical protein